MKTVAIIQARAGSTRLPGKVFKTIAGKPMLAHMIERVQKAKKLNAVVLATSDAPADDATAALGESCGVPVFRGNELDVLDRFYNAAKHAGAEAVVRLTGDCVLHDPQVIDEVIERFLEKKVDYTSTPANYPEGLDTEVFSLASLERAWREAKLPSEREHVTPYIKNHPELFSIDGRWVSGAGDNSTIHWSVDTQADFDFASAVYAHLYPHNASFTKNDVLALLARQPVLLDINKGGTGFEGLHKSLKEDEEWKLVRRMVLGTVEFGMEYGLDKQIVQPAKEEAWAILDAAFAAGIDTFDTAAAYGTAEDVLGGWIEARDMAGKVKVISKLKPHVLEEYPGGTSVTDVVRTEVGKSLKRLRVDVLNGYLLHTPEYVYRDDMLEALHTVKKEGLVRNVGVSIYDEPEALETVRRGLDYVQVPYNALDQRLDKIAFWTEANSGGVTVFARSPFLQGLLLMNPGQVPPHLVHAKLHVEKFIAIAHQYGLTQAQAALLFALHGCPAQQVVFGVKTLAQLEENLATASTKVPSGFIEAVKKIGGTLDRAVVNPSLWSKIKK